MKVLSIEEIKIIQLNMLKFFDKVCRDNNLNYSLESGSLLGAIRHKGYIPWDDDLDVSLVRADYEHLLSILSKINDNNYKVLTYNNNKTYFYPFAKLCDSRTTLIEQDVYKINGYGVYIDIFPIDYLPQKDTMMAKIYWSLLIHLKRLIGYRATDCTNNNIKNNRCYLAIKFLLDRIDITFFGRLMDRTAQMFNYFKTPFAGNSLWAYGKRGTMNISVFDEYFDSKFENITVRLIKQYDILLTAYYGNYMQLPPKEQRKAPHFYDAYLR